MKLSTNSLAARIVRANFPNERLRMNLCPFGRRLIASIVFLPLTAPAFLAIRPACWLSDDEDEVPFVIRVALGGVLYSFPWFIGFKLVPLSGYIVQWIVGLCAITAVGLCAALVIYILVKTIGGGIKIISSPVVSVFEKVKSNSIWTTFSAFIKAGHDMVCPQIEWEEVKETEKQTT